MCGIAGYISKKKPQKKILKNGNQTTLTILLNRIPVKYLLSNICTK